MYVTNTLQKPPPYYFCINPYFLEQLKVKRTRANTFIYTGSPVGDKPVAFVPPIPGLFSQHLPVMKRLAAAGWPCSSGCPGTMAGLGGGGPQPGLLLGGNVLLGFRREQRES